MSEHDDCTSAEGDTTLEIILNPEILTLLARVCNGDTTGETAEQVRGRFAAAGLLEALRLEYQPPPKVPSTEFPEAWTAYQIGLFDNGDQRDSRNREKSTKTRFAFDIKVWTGTNPDFRSAPDWNSTCNLWTRQFARKHFDKLATRGAISAKFAQFCIEAVNGTDDSWLLGIPFKRTVRTGSKYGDGHLCMLKVVDGCASMAAFVVGNVDFIVDNFVNTDPSGKALTNVIGAARVSRISLPHWETQTVA